jgi:Cu2+-exporting ATPase
MAAKKNKSMYRGGRSAFGAFRKVKEKNLSSGRFKLSLQTEPQIAKIASQKEKTDIVRDVKSADQHLAVSVASLGLAVGGTMLFPPLSLLGWMGYFYASAHFFKGAYNSIVYERKLKMVVVDAVMFTGILATGSLVAGTLMCSLMWYAEKLLLKTEDRSRKSLVNIFGKQPRSVWVLKDGVEVELPFGELQAGDIIVVNAGEVVPADGTIIRGMASIDQHTLTGESQPAEKVVGEPVFATTLVLSGQIHIQVEKAGTDSVAAQIGEVLLQTADFKEITQARWVEFVDKTAPVTLGVGALALPLLGTASAVSLLYSFNYGYSMRVIAPATMLNFLNLASQNGILIKDGRSLELLNKVDTVVFDKTGTLTLDQPVVGQIHTCNDVSQETLLTYAAAAEYRQTHPIARAILQAADERGLNLPDIDTAQYEVGYGIKVRLANKIIHVGSMRFMAISAIAIPPEIEIIQQRAHESGASLVMVAVDKQLEGAIELVAVIRPEAFEIIRLLRKRKMSMYIISGDTEAPTKQLAQALGIENYFAETLPENKADLVAQLQQEGKSVCFIGDGINDSIALKKANVSISMRGATTIATDTAQIVLMDGSLKQLVQLFDVAKNYNHNLKQSFLITLIPTATAVGGILFLHFGIAASVILYYAGLAAGMSNTIRPMLKKRRK